jgi:hypothetical protein
MTRTQGVRRWIRRTVKWGLVVILGLIAVNWTAAYFIASANQRKIDELHTVLGARSLQELATGRAFGGQDVNGNGWFLVLGAFSCMRETSCDALFDEQGNERGAPGATPMSDEQRAAVDEDLNHAHLLLELARKAPRIVTVLSDSNPPHNPLRHTWASCHYVKLAVLSARDRLEAGDEAKAAERLSDVLMVTRHAFEQPGVVSYLVAITHLEALLERLGPSVQLLAEASLERLEKGLGEIDFEDRLKMALGGDALFILSLWEDGMGPELQRWSGCSSFVRWIYPRLLSEIDRSVYLDIALTQVREAASGRFESALVASVPFYAPVTARVRPWCGPSLARTQEQRARMLAIAREAIRLQLAHCREGTWPQARTDVDGIPIQVTETEDSITLAEPSGQDRAPYQIVLRK